VNEQEQSEVNNSSRIYFTTTYKIPYESIYRSLDQKKEYVTANNLFKKAIQLGLDAGSTAIQELNTFMKEFIKKHSPNHTNHQELNQKYNKKKSPAELNSSDLNMQNSSDSTDESYTDNDIENIDPSLIQNPVIRSKKGAYRKTRFKGSQEIKKKVSAKVSTRKPMECQQCYKARHNKAGCEKWHKKNQI
ncbi:36004_t:CDS:1, partial [Racocetra persica]